ncbi:hypothetical protein [Legionella waltersii]|uniref:Dot/Icm secretion system substrate n=1 Tax=Legionella waltersii TaxID=66969 RepID=A0A0W1ACS9_9GAMM|nr:hypothetical protein [Legionella waltersii]KTD79180.1 Dot/Icm secretion system substrate [Legionella waltersii]SNV12392.1 Dot/Icm secretion system substrate [Legionella waltersii]
MAAQLDSSTEFAALVAQLQSNPNDPALKQAVIRHLPEMRVLAKTNPIAMYHLAMVYAPGSAQYKQMMLQAAAEGSTNAMLAVCDLYLKTGSATDLLTAAHYMRLIQKSGDSYIMKQGRELMDRYPDFAEQMQSDCVCRKYNPALSFFAQEPKRQTNAVSEQTCIPTP